MMHNLGCLNKFILDENAKKPIKTMGEYFKKLTFFKSFINQT